jgi:hypothetical protein
MLGASLDHACAARHARWGINPPPSVTHTRGCCLLLARPTSSEKKKKKKKKTPTTATTGWKRPVLGWMARCVTDRLPIRNTWPPDRLCPGLVELVGLA